MARSLSVDGESVEAGEKKVIDLNIARLVSGTKIDLPIHVYRSKKSGPIVMLSGGLHGDEVDGVEIIRRLIRSKTFDKLKCGSVIAIPILNIYGFLNFSREVPDGKDVNRFFPGSKNGSLASRVAYNLTKKVLAEIDFGIDFHTGGANRYNYPQSRFAPEDKRAKEIAEIFNAPISLESGLIDKSLRKEAYKMGKSIVVYEGGEAMRFDELSIEEGVRGAKRVLAHYGMIETGESLQNHTHCSQSQWVRAKRSGLFQSLVKSGEWVDKKDVIAYISDPFGDKQIKIKAPEAGIIVGHNNAPVVNQGDALFHLGMQ
ncbi:MAG: succinylglutamate desuccinylase/aspartoacylase family protein [Vicingaceae bacterium]